MCEYILNHVLQCENQGTFKFLKIIPATEHAPASTEEKHSCSNLRLETKFAKCDTTKECIARVNGLPSEDDFETTMIGASPSQMECQKDASHLSPLALLQLERSPRRSHAICTTNRIPTFSTATDPAAATQVPRDKEHAETDFSRTIVSPGQGSFAKAVWRPVITRALSHRLGCLVPFPPVTTEPLPETLNKHLPSGKTLNNQQHSNKSPRLSPTSKTLINHQDSQEPPTPPQKSNINPNHQESLQPPIFSLTAKTRSNQQDSSKSPSLSRTSKIPTILQDHYKLLPVPPDSNLQDPYQTSRFSAILLQNTSSPRLFLSTKRVTFSPKCSIITYRKHRKPTVTHVQLEDFEFRRRYWILKCLCLQVRVQKPRHFLDSQVQERFYAENCCEAVTRYMRGRAEVVCTHWQPQKPDILD